jgi:hypothetical protein
MADREAEPEPRKDLRRLCLVCVIALALPAAIAFLLGGMPLLGFAALIILVPLAAYAPTNLAPRKVPPMYARAIARIKFGKYNEAELEIIRELERWEDDFEGWMMLADLYANHFNDLSEAERTVRELCDSPKVTPSQISVALHRLADWELKLGQNPDAARRALRMVIERLPGTHLAHMAQLRIRQLPVTAEELQEQQTAKRIPLPALGDDLDKADEPATSFVEVQKATRAANACVQRLKEDPNDIAAREKLARIFAEHLRKADLGIAQLGLLLAIPGQAMEKQAEWLGLTAAWHLKYRHDREAARPVLERLSREFPGTPQALAAKRRLSLMAMNAR